MGLSLIECRRRLDEFMDFFTHRFYEKLQQRLDVFVDESASTRGMRDSAILRHTKDLPMEMPENLRKMCPCRRRAPDIPPSGSTVDSFTPATARTSRTRRDNGLRSWSKERLRLVEREAPRIDHNW